MKKILLVSNLEPFLERNKILLNRAGFLIITATSAEQALQTYREQPTDLIISLLDLPGMGGDELCSAMWQDRKLRQAPFILICYETAADLERASRCGANAWVIKPVRPELLLKQVSRFLNIPTRREYRAAFRASLNGTRGSIPFSGLTRNISVSGLLCETEMHLDRDDLVTNLLLAIDSHQIVADGRVVWTESRPDGRHHCGLQFSNLSPGSREKIESFIDAPEQRTTSGGRIPLPLL